MEYSIFHLLEKTNQAITLHVLSFSIGLDILYLLLYNQLL